jgi:hypothetical protein
VLCGSAIALSTDDFLTRAQFARIQEPGCFFVSWERQIAGTVSRLPAILLTGAIRFSGFTLLRRAAVRSALQYQGPGFASFRVSRIVGAPIKRLVLMRSVR